MIKSLPILEKKKILFFIIVLVLIVLPAVYVHAEGLVPSCNTGAINATTGQYENPCNFNTVMGLINKMIDFLLFYFATPLAALAICYAGFKLLTAGGSPEQMTKAKHIIRNVIIGYILALGAWLIVHTIFSTLGFKGNTFLKDQDIAKTEVAPQPVTTSLPQPISQETKKDDSGVLFIGGSYTEENPNGDTCNNPDSKPLPGSGNYTDPNNYNYPNFNSYLGPTKVYAGELTEESKKVQQVRLRASEFRIARCWLVGWYTNRYIYDSKIRNEFNQMKPKLLERLKTPSFMILDEKVYNNKYKGYEASLGLSTGDLIAIKNSTSSIASIAVHELTHHAENNGNLLPQAQTERIQELFPDPIIIGYFEDLYTQDLESYIKEKNADDHFKESIIPKLNYYYCYVVHSLDFDTACYETNYLKKNKIKGEIIPNLDTEFTNYTELTARIMQVRFKENFDPKEILSLEKIKSILKEEDPNLFGELVMEYSGIYQSELYEPLNVLKNISTFSVAGDHNCNSTNPTRELLKENKIVCYFGVKSSGEFVSRQYIFKSEDEAILSIKDAIARKILNLFNNSM